MISALTKSHEPEIVSNGTHATATAATALARVQRLLKATPLIDGHNDFPFLLRQQLRNQIYKHDLRDNLSCHTSIAKMRKGMMGGQFWSIYVPNPEELRLVVPDDDEKVGDGGLSGHVNINGTNGTSGTHICGCEHVYSGKARKGKGLGLNEPNHAVRDTLEQIDITHRLIRAYPNDFTLCTTPSAGRHAHASGQIASMLGIEGGHSTGNSLAPLRLFFDMGVRYMTLTHNSDNAFGTSWISVDPVVPGGKDHGLTKFGEACVREMNRLGMMVDLSHVSAETMRGALRVARAPVIFSHSGARAKTNIGRNVPDDVLKIVRQNGGVVMVPSVALFVKEGEDFIQATVDDFIDHVLHIARLIGWEHVGLGSDFDGCVMTVKGLEDTSTWPGMISRLIEREPDITDEQLEGLIGENVLRVWEQAESVAHQMQSQGELPSEEHWDGRIWEPKNPDVPRIYPASS